MTINEVGLSQMRNRMNWIGKLKQVVSTRSLWQSQKKRKVGDGGKKNGRRSLHSAFTRKKDRKIVITDWEKDDEEEEEENVESEAVPEESDIEMALIPSKPNGEGYLTRLWSNLYENEDDGDNALKEDVKNKMRLGARPNELMQQLKVLVPDDSEEPLPL